MINLILLITAKKERKNQMPIINQTAARMKKLNFSTITTGEWRSTTIKIILSSRS